MTLIHVARLLNITLNRTPYQFVVGKWARVDFSAIWVYLKLLTNRKMNEYISEKLDAQGKLLDDITRKQLIWYGRVERMNPTRLKKGKNEAVPGEPGKMEYIQL
jgi:hypothetical protein